MVGRCAKVGVNIIADAVINHAAAGPNSSGRLQSSVRRTLGFESKAWRRMRCICWCWYPRSPEGIMLRWLAHHFLAGSGVGTAGSSYGGRTTDAQPCYVT